MTDNRQYLFIEETEKRGYIAISNEFGDSSEEEPVDSEAALLSTGDIKQSSFSRNSIASSPLFAEDDGPAATASLDRPSLPIPSINNLIKQQLTEIEADTSVNFKEKSRHLLGDVSVIRGGHPIGIGNLVQKGKKRGSSTTNNRRRKRKHETSCGTYYVWRRNHRHFHQSVQPGHRSRSDGRKVLPGMKMRNEERPDEEPCAVAEWEWRPCKALLGRKRGGTGRCVVIGGSLERLRWRVASGGCDCGRWLRSEVAGGGCEGACEEGGRGWRMGWPVAAV
nr:hypothetical protein Itr_chr12CG15010 [Ipomoea trifida]